MTLLWIVRELESWITPKYQKNTLDTTYLVKETLGGGGILYHSGLKTHMAKLLEVMLTVNSILKRPSPKD